MFGPPIVMLAARLGLAASSWTVPCTPPATLPGAERAIVDAEVPTIGLLIVSVRGWFTIQLLLPVATVIVFPGARSRVKSSVEPDCREMLLPPTANVKLLPPM